MANGDLVLLVEESHNEIRQFVDVNSGQVREEKDAAKELCQQLGVRYKPLTKALQGVVLYERKSKTDGKKVPVRLGDLGPFVLCRVDQSTGTIANGFGMQDLPKPVRLSSGTVKQLAAIFGGNRPEARKS